MTDVIFEGTGRKKLFFAVYSNSKSHIKHSLIYDVLADTIDCSCDHSPFRTRQAGVRKKREKKYVVGAAGTCRHEKAVREELINKFKKLVAMMKKELNNTPITTKLTFICTLCRKEYEESMRSQTRRNKCRLCMGE